MIHGVQILGAWPRRSSEVLAQLAPRGNRLAEAKVDRVRHFH